jgi:hypothetical protein
MRQISIVLLFLAVVDISRSVALQQQQNILNSDVINKKLLPDVKHLLKANNDGNRQKFLHLLNSLDVDGYKFVNGKCSCGNSLLLILNTLLTMIHSNHDVIDFNVINKIVLFHFAFHTRACMQLTHFDVILIVLIRKQASD